MGDLLGLAVAGLILVVVVVRIAVRDGRRAAERYGALPCPRCGVRFGAGGYSTWHVRERLRWRCRQTSGPYLTCRRCRTGFRFTAAGEPHPDPFFDAVGEQQTTHRNPDDAESRP